MAPSAFGLARLRAQRGDLNGALDALDRVPATSGSYVEARRRRADLLAYNGAGLSDLSAALVSVDEVTLDPVDRAQLNVRVLDSALQVVLDQGPRPDVTIAGHPAQESALRDALEEAYRRFAELHEPGPERVELVDAANRIRRWTLR